MAELAPGLILIFGALLVPLLPQGKVRNAYMALLPVLGFWGLTQTAPGVYGGFEAFGYQFVPVRVDSLSLVFGYIFHIAVLLSVVYAFHIRDTVQQVAGLVYAGAAIGGVFAGDLITLFVYWEGTAIASVFLIWASRNEHALRAGMRYLIIHVGSGVLLIAGAVIHLYFSPGSMQQQITMTSRSGATVRIAFSGIPALMVNGDSLSINRDFEMTEISSNKNPKASSE